MSRFVLVPGAGGAGWAWHLVAARLRAAGHEAVAVDLPAADPAAGLATYVAMVAAACGDEPDVVLAAHSFGAFSAVPVAARRPVSRLVLVNAMVPAPGESFDGWGAATRADFGGGEWDEEALFFHDLAPELADGLRAAEAPEEGSANSDPCPFTAWPDVPTVVVVARDDRVFPVEFQRRVARERLGLDVVEVPGGHMAALSEPDAVASALLAPPD